MQRRALLCVVGATALAGCGGPLRDDETTEPESAANSTPTDSDTPSTDATATSTESPLDLASHDLVRSNEGSASELAAVTGEVRNSSDQTVAEATVTATFEDADGEVLDQASASASDLSPDQSWTFELIYPGAGEDARTVADYALTVETDS